MSEERASIEQGTDINLQNNQLRNHVLHVSPVDPENPEAGKIYFNSVENVVKQYDGTQWKDISSGKKEEGGGESGTGGGGGQYLKYDHDTYDNTWTIRHDMGKWPQVQILTYTTPPKHLRGQVTYISENEVQVSFNTPVKGYAILE